MNIENTQNAIKVMQAYCEGKEIECKSKFQNEEWWSLGNDAPCWDWASCKYRIKSEATIRPYEKREECFADAIKHNGWLKTKKDGSYEFLDGIETRTSGKLWLHSNYGGFDADYMLENYVWADDGSPCGVKED